MTSPKDSGPKQPGPRQPDPKQPPRYNKQILEEAAQWFVDFREGDVDPATHPAFTQWLRRSPEHIEAYLEITSFWADLPLVANERTTNIEALIEYAKTESNIETLRHPRGGGGPSSSFPAVEESRQPEVISPARTRLRLTSWAIAASALIGCATIAGWLYLQRGTYATGVGEQHSVALADGSLIDLNSRSRIRVRFSDHERDVDLVEGQALFRVAKDLKRPFIVRTDSMRVRAVGTQFDVYRKTTGTTVTVIEGTVVVTTPEPIASPLPVSREGARRAQEGVRERSKPLLVSAGEQVTVSAHALAQTSPANVEAATAWTQRKLVFRATPLADVVEEFNRYNARQMSIQDPQIGSLRISGSFSSTDPSSLIKFLQQLPSITVQETDTDVRILSR